MRRGHFERKHVCFETRALESGVRRVRGYSLLGIRRRQSQFIDRECSVHNLHSFTSEHHLDCGSACDHHRRSCQPTTTFSHANCSCLSCLSDRSFSLVPWTLFRGQTLRALRQCCPLFSTSRSQSPLLIRVIGKARRTLPLHVCPQITNTSYSGDGTLPHAISALTLTATISPVFSLRFVDRALAVFFFRIFDFAVIYAQDSGFFTHICIAVVFGRVNPATARSSSRIIVRSA